MLSLPRIASVLPLVALLAIMPAMADAEAPDGTPKHGIAMHGDPKYPADFAHLDYAEPEAPKGGTIRHAVTGTFDSLNPFIIKGRAAAAVMGPQVYESLMARVWDEPFSLYGLIAESIAVAPDNSWVEFRLRPEARWHDGSPITPEDVLFSWQTLRDGGRPNHRTYYAKVASAAVTGERTVRFRLADTDDRELPLILGLMPVLSKQYWQDREFGETTLEPPLTSGPYRVASVDPGRSVTLERVRDYWGRDLPLIAGHHNFDIIRYDYYRDEGVSLEAFKAGEYDFRRETDATRWAAGYDFPAARNGGVVLETIAHGRPEWVRGLIFNTRRPMFEDRRVREALAHAFDFEWMNRTLFSGSFKRIDSFYPNSDLAADGPPGEAELALLEPFRDVLPPEVFQADYRPPTTDGSGMRGLRRNLRHAGELLDEAGWPVRDGVRVDAGTNRPFEFEILLRDPSDEKIALEFARALDRLGITARVRTVDSAQYTARLEAFDFDMTLNRWISTLSPGNEQVYYWGSEAADQPGSRNYPGIRNPAVDALAESLAEAATREELVSRVHALDRVLTWGHYMIPLYYLGEDRFAYWSHLRRPGTVPVYGTVIETWWDGRAAE